MNNMALHMIREMFHKREHSFMVKLRFWFHPILTIYIYSYCLPCNKKMLWKLYDKQQKRLRTITFFFKFLIMLQTSWFKGFYFFYFIFYFLHVPHMISDISKNKLIHMQITCTFHVCLSNIFYGFKIQTGPDSRTGLTGHWYGFLNTKNHKFNFCRKLLESRSNRRVW